MDLESLPGAPTLIGWFGYMPSFHDAEIIEIRLLRDGESTIAIHCWHTSNALDANGCFVQEKHAVVTFRLTGVSDLSLGEFNHQNVIAGIEVDEVNGEFKLELLPCYGVAGKITATQISVELQPGKTDSQS